MSTPSAKTEMSRRSVTARDKRKKLHACTWPGCDRMFACPHNVEQHIREKHTHERPYACEVCARAGIDKAFARPYLLYRHQRSLHKMTIDTDRQRRPSTTQSLKRKRSRTEKSPESSISDLYSFDGTTELRSAPQHDRGPIMSSYTPFPTQHDAFAAYDSTHMLHSQLHHADPVSHASLHGTYPQATGSASLQYALPQIQPPAEPRDSVYGGSPPRVMYPTANQASYRLPHGNAFEKASEERPVQVQEWYLPPMTDYPFGNLADAGFSFHFGGEPGQVGHIDVSSWH